MQNDLQDEGRAAQGRRLAYAPREGADDRAAPRAGPEGGRAMSGYNGWTNYETWNVALWLSNDEGTYTFTREMAQECRDEAADHANVPSIWTSDEAARFTLADRLKDFVDELAPDLGASMFADLLGAAMSEVDWPEIADNLLSEVDA
jgi:hypothetical protein